MAHKRITYTAEFKLQAVQMIVDQHLSVAEVARRLGINANMLHLWKKAFLAHGPDAFPGSTTSKCFSTASINILRWGTVPQWSSSGRITRSTLNFDSIFLGKDQTVIAIDGTGATLCRAVA